MNNGIVTAIAIAAVYISSLTQTAFAAVISVEPAYQEVSTGEEFTVNITVDPDGGEISGAQCTLLFDNSLLQALRQDKGSFLSQDGASTMEIMNVINNTIGKVEYGEMRTGVDYGVTTPGVLATITFNATKYGMCDFKLDNVVLSDPDGYEFSGVSVNNGTCEIGRATPAPSPAPTSTPTQTPSPAPASGSRDSSNGDTFITPTPTPTPLPYGADNGNEGASVTPAQIPGSTSTPSPAQTQFSTPAQSPPSSSTTAISPSPAASTPLLPENNKKLSGFETVFVIAGLLVIAYLILKSREGGDRKNE